MRIFIDPGHGGKDPGAVAGGVFEKDVVLGTALELAQVLEWHEWDVCLSRRTDIFVPLERRAETATDARPGLFLSLHTNAAGSQAVGPEAWVRAGDDAAGRAAAFLRPWAERAVNDPWRGTKVGTFYVLRNVRVCPAVLLEIEFLTGPGEAETLVQRLYQERVAHYLAYGLLAWAAANGNGR